MQTLALQIPDPLYDRLRLTATATGQPLHAIVLRALEIGAPPGLEDIPPDLQPSLVELDTLSDTDLFAIAATHQPPQDFARYQTLLDRDERTEPEQQELDRLRHEADTLMLRKAHAAALLRWRGRTVPIDA